MTSLLTRCLGYLVRGMCWFPVVFVVCFMLWCYYVSVFVVMILQGPGWAHAACRASSPLVMLMTCSPPFIGLPDKPIAVRGTYEIIGPVRGGQGVVAALQRMCV